MATTDRKVMLVVGATGSIGSAIAREASAQGWTVVVHGRNPEKITALVAELNEIWAIPGDLTVAGSAEQIVEEAAGFHGRLDAVIDCTAAGPSGGQLTGLFKDTTPALYGAFLDLSAGWLQRLAHAAYPYLATRGGTLIAFVSDAGRFAAANQTIVGTARAATIGFVRNLAIEAARDGIRAHCISPSYVAGSESARKIGSERMAKAAARAGLGLPTAEDIAPLAMFLCGDGAAKITGQVISVNGGLNA